MARSRGWTITINNYNDEDLDIFALFYSGVAKYIIYGFETGEQGTEHIQGYVYYKNSQVLKTVKKHFPRAHLEVAQGTPQQNFNYCSKDGQFYELGTLPVQGRAIWDKVEEAMRNPKDNLVLYNQYRRAYNEIIKSEKKEHPRLFRIISDKYLVSVVEMHMSNNETVSIPGADYNCEDVIIYNRHPPSWFQFWLMGCPHKERRGYEIISYDPIYLYVCVENKDLPKFKKIYSQYIDSDFNAKKDLS